LLHQPYGQLCTVNWGRRFWSTSLPPPNFLAEIRKTRVLFCCKAISCPSRIRLLQRNRHLRTPLSRRRSWLTFRHLLVESLFKDDTSNRLHVVVSSRYGAIPGSPIFERTFFLGFLGFLSNIFLISAHSSYSSIAIKSSIQLPNISLY